jgi:hypothetical protein
LLTSALPAFHAEQANSAQFFSMSGAIDLVARLDTGGEPLFTARLGKTARCLN